MITAFVSECLNHADITVSGFGEYFKEYYAPRASEWAIGLRSILASTTNMSLESFHKVLKHNAAFMDGKYNNRLDLLISHVIKYQRIPRSRQLKANAAQRCNTTQTTMNFKSHKEAAVQSISLVSEMSNGWSVKSFVSHDITYEVKETLVQCPYQPCYQACTDCGVCYHNFTCTCAAAVNAHNRTSSCKHAHLVKM